MHIAIHETAAFDHPREAVWAVLTDLRAMPLFTGFGPIPGIASACFIEGDGYRVGAVREIVNRDGSRHRETIVALQPPALLQDRIHDFTSPLRLLASEATDRFELGASGAGTILTRTFTVQLRSLLALPAVLLLRPLLRAALCRHHAALSAHLLETNRVGKTPKADLARAIQRWARHAESC